MGFKGARLLKIPGVKEEKKNDRELRADIDHIISENNYSDLNMNSEQNTINTEGACRKEVDKCKASVCGKCHARFESRNELFRHIDKEGHVVGSDGEEENIEHINRVASGRGRKKAGEAGTTTD